MKSFIGQTLGQYHLEALLGTGGMGQVYRGVHKLLDRPAAIKVMLPNFASKPQFRARFLQEAKTAAALRHPNIVEIYEFGEQNGILYLVMELLNDGSLHSLLGQQNGQALPLPLALDLGSQIAEGLAAAHHQQLIHRDIKPANLLLRNQPDALPGREQYLLKISDFGLARLIESNIESITATGALMGTLAYMSPEQFIPNKQIDGRADIYALGVVLYEMITGYPPFQIARITDALEKHMNVLPPPPRSIRPELPPLVEEIVLRCLAKKPEDRFATGKALSTALQNVLGNTDSGVFSMAEPHSSTNRATIVSPIVTVAPPVISTMPGYSDVPRIRVLDQKGQTLQVIEVSSQGITVGRHVSNAIVLASHVISRQHLHISWNGQQVMVKDLGSSNGTILGETRLLPDAIQTWEERKMIRLGSFWLRLESASSSQVFTTTSMPLSTAPAAARALPAPSLPKKPNFGGALSLMHERIGLSVTPKTLSITPGQPAQIQISLTNMGPLVDWFTPTIEGVPAEWIQGAGHAIQLNPGMQESINLIINVARHPDNQAKEYPVTIRAHSRETPEDCSTTTAVWIVQTFKEEALRLEPRRASGRGKAVYSVALSNGSNTATNYTLYGDDDEQQLKYQFQRNPIELGAGQEVRIPLKVQTRRRLIGRERRVPFQLHSGPIDKPSTQTIAGEFVNQALLPAWVIPAVSALLIAGVIASKLLGIIPAFSSSIPPTPVPTSLAQITVPLAPGVTPPPLATPTSLPVPKATPVPAATPTSVPAPQVTPAPRPTPGHTPPPPHHSTPTPTPHRSTPTPTPTPKPSGPPHVKTITPLVTGLGGAIGSQYVASQDSLYFVEFNGKLSVLRHVHQNPTYAILGTGYTEPEAISIASNGNTAYITERSGDLVRVNLSTGPNRSQATAIIPGGLTVPHQMVLDEANKVLYVGEWASPGRLIKVDLTGSIQPQTVLGNLQNAIGLLLAPDGKTVYVTEQLSNGKGQLVRYNLASPGAPKTILATSSTAPLFEMSWANGQKTAILVTERDPANKVWYFDLKQPSLLLQPVATLSNAAFRPSSVVTASNNGTSLPILVCSDGEIDRLT